jgi:hypothetical protein
MGLAEGFRSVRSAEDAPPVEYAEHFRPSGVFAGDLADAGEARLFSARMDLPFATSGLATTRRTSGLAARTTRRR